ncbi:FHA domain-containing protein [Leucobacter chinensis]|uniref:FHA domain-containing protein n=1 Tax=Leucobacter chinensis TaxID=2851010 RepID=UPI001C248535
MLTYAVHGQGSALVTERLILLADVPLDEASELWSSVREYDASFESVLSALAGRGIGQLRDFALLEFVPGAQGAVSTALRGRATIELDGDTYSGEGVTTWSEASADRVTCVTLRLDEAPRDTPSLPLNRGVVQTSELVWGHEPLEQFSLTNTSETDRSALFRNAPALRAMTETNPEEQTIVRRTVPQWMLRFSSGKVVGIGDRVVIGRRPTPIVDNGEKLETLLSPQREVSANHAVLRGLEDGVEIIDLGSKNGTVVQPEGSEIALLRGGSSTVLRAGDTVDFGDGNVAECVRASHP